MFCDNNRKYIIEKGVDTLSKHQIISPDTVVSDYGAGEEVADILDEAAAAAAVAAVAVGPRTTYFF